MWPVVSWQTHWLCCLLLFDQWTWVNGWMSVVSSLTICCHLCYDGVCRPVVSCKSWGQEAVWSRVSAKASGQARVQKATTRTRHAWNHGGCKYFSGTASVSSVRKRSTSDSFPFPFVRQCVFFLYNPPIFFGGLSWNHLVCSSVVLSMCLIVSAQCLLNCSTLLFCCWNLVWCIIIGDVWCGKVGSQSSMWRSRQGFR